MKKKDSTPEFSSGLGSARTGSETEFEPENRIRIRTSEAQARESEGTIIYVVSTQKKFEAENGRRESSQIYEPKTYYMYM